LFFILFLISCYNEHRYPDVSLLGYNYLIYVNGSEQAESGTSASAPTFGGMISLVNALRKKDNKNSLGWINPVLYSPEGLAVFRGTIYDMLSGSNKCTAADNGNLPDNSTIVYSTCCLQGFYCAPGWDPVTGRHFHFQSINFMNF